jgi:hypothetical protein
MERQESEDSEDEYDYVEEDEEEEEEEEDEEETWAAIEKKRLAAKKRKWVEAKRGINRRRCL